MGLLTPADPQFSGFVLMFTIQGKSCNHFCDGLPRRNFLKIGGLGLGGLALPDLLRAEAQSGLRRSHKAVIMIYLPGGPPHQDMYDIKTEAPSEIRGEFKPIKTNDPASRFASSCRAWRR